MKYSVLEFGCSAWHERHCCQAQRKHIPNYVAVGYYNHGDLFAAVDRLNKLSP